MLYCLIISLIFHKICAHRPEMLDQTLPFSLFNLFSPFCCHSLLILLLSFSSHLYLVCLLSIFFEMFVEILYNPICYHIYCPSHTVWSHVPNDSSVQVQDFCFPVCVQLPFSVVLRSQWIGTSLSVTLLRWSYMFCIFFTFLAFLFMSRWISVVSEQFRVWVCFCRFLNH